jgi:hypothetical protein
MVGFIFGVYNGTTAYRSPYYGGNGRASDSENFLLLESSSDTEVRCRKELEHQG